MFRVTVASAALLRAALAPGSRADPPADPYAAPVRKWSDRTPFKAGR